jgi:hypothetical protein
VEALSGVGFASRKGKLTGVFLMDITFFRPRVGKTSTAGKAISAKEFIINGMIKDPMNIRPGLLERHG